MKKLLVLVQALLCMSAMANEKVKIIAEDDWYPYSAAINGKPEGMSVDLVRAAYKAVGIDVEYEIMGYTKCMKDVSDGHAVGCFDTIIDETVKQTQVFPAEPMFKAKLLIYGPASSTESGLKVKDLAGKTVGIVNGYTYGDEFEASKDIKRDVAPQDINNFKKIAAGRIQYAIAYEKVAQSIIGKNKADLDGKLKPIGEVAEYDVFTSFSKKHKDGPRMAKLLEDGLKKIKASKEYDTIVAAWEKRLAEGK